MAGAEIHALFRGRYICCFVCVLVNGVGGRNVGKVNVIDRRICPFNA